MIKKKKAGRPKKIKPIDRIKNDITSEADLSNAIHFDLGSLYPKQIEFCKATTRRVAYGGARGGGKSYATRFKSIGLSIYYPGIQILLLRRTLNELRENHTIPLMKKLLGIAQYKEVTKEFVFPNGSRIKLGYCDNEKDVLQYQGQSYDVIFMEEATMFTEFQYQSLTECNRLSGQCETFTTPRMYFTCNPGGVGHMWVKRLFIDREYKRKEKPEDYTFIKALVYDNKFLMENDPEYVTTLENLPEDRRKAMLYGDWDIFEGQYFTEFSRDIHVIEKERLSWDWNRYIALDYGLDMLAAIWVAVDPYDNTYVYKELYKSGLIISEAAEEIKKMIKGYESIIKIYAPPDLWNKRQETGKSAYDIFRDNGVKLTKSKNDRILGWYSVKEYLKVIESRDEQTGLDIKTSKLKIFRNCENLIRCLPQIQHDDSDPNDTSNTPHEITHILDALRYFCIERTYPTKEKTEEMKALEGLALSRRREQVLQVAGESADSDYIYFGG